MRIIVTSIALAMSLITQPAVAQQAAPIITENGYAALLALHDELRAYMVPGFTTGVVLVSGAKVGEEYDNALMRAKLAGLAKFEARLAAMPVKSWTPSQQVDFLVVKSILNGYRFNLAVMRPWRRDPGFYLDPLLRVAFSDVPASGEKLTTLRAQLGAIPPMIAAARRNLDAVPADFADLALYNLEKSDGVNHYHPYRAVPPPGILGWYDDLLARVGKDQPELLTETRAARDAVFGFHRWLKAERPRMTAKAGVGEARLQWYLRHVRMMPYSTGQMLDLAAREHQRLGAALALTQHRNRNLPEIALSTSDAEQKAKVAATDKGVRDWIRANRILTIPDYIGELRANAPYIERPGGPNFWEKVQFRDPIPDHLHATIPGHNFDSELARRDTRPIRGGFADGIRLEGWAMYLEEAMPLAGALDGHSPRAIELIYRFGIFRATRVPADIYMQHNRWSVAEAVKHMRDGTPWLDEDVARVDAEIYLRRPPGYGLSYMIGKLQLDALLAERAQQLDDKFVLGDFHDQFLAAGRLPIALIRYEMTGRADEIAAFWNTPPIPAPD